MPWYLKVTKVKDIYQHRPRKSFFEPTTGTFKHITEKIEIKITLEVSSTHSVFAKEIAINKAKLAWQELKEQDVDDKYCKITHCNPCLILEEEYEASFDINFRQEKEKRK